MSSGMVSRWPVLVSLPVASVDRDHDGRLTEAAVARLFAAARTTYFEGCATIDAATLVVRSGTVEVGTAVPGPSGVSVSVGVVEVLTDSFVMTTRIRPHDSDGIAATARCTLSPGGPVSREMRDEFIALAHAAAHFH